MELKNLSRREFLAGTCAVCGTAFLSPVLFSKKLTNWINFNIQEDYKKELIKNAPLARYWTYSNSQNAQCKECHTEPQLKQKNYDHKEKYIKCLLCAQGCVIEDGRSGKCRARMNVNGELKSLVYGRPIAIHTDPIEKKPFYHFLPGSYAYSLATAGCPLSCQFCQNWQISQAKPEDYNVNYISANDIVKNTLLEKSPIIAFTYNEPTVFIEYMIDIAAAARKQNIKSVLVSCGFMNSEPLKELCNHLDAIKIDLKGFSEDFYRNVSSAELKPVLNTIKQIAKSKVHLEVVNLVVPTLNDSEKMLSGLVDWILSEAGPDVPLHFTRFHPDYKLLNLQPTPISTLVHAREMAMSKGMHYVFVGNVPGNEGNSTYCPHCKKPVIIRNGFLTLENHLKNGKCEYCNTHIAGVWK